MKRALAAAAFLALAAPASAWAHATLLQTKPAFAQRVERSPRVVLLRFDQSVEALPNAGSGTASIKSVLHYLENWGHPRPVELPLAEAVVLVNRLLMTAAQFDTATGGVHPERGDFATIKFLSTHGLQSISPDAQAQFWKNQ